MKKYKVIKGISVAFAIITLLSVLCICAIELVNIEIAKDWTWFIKLCVELDLDVEDDGLKECLLHYATILTGFSYILTFIMWLITFKVGAKAIVKSRKQVRQTFNSEVTVNTDKDLKQLKKKAVKETKEATKEAVKKEKKENLKHKKHKEKETEINVNINVEKKDDLITAGKNKIDSILKNL